MAASSFDQLSDTYLGRRFSGILLADNLPRSAADVAEALRLQSVVKLGLLGSNPAWKADYLFPRSLYPYGLGQRHSGGNYIHRVYLLQDGNLTMVLAPYVRLLESMRLTMGPDAATREFGSLGVDEAFAVYTVDSPGGTHVSQIVMGSTSGVDQIEYVTLGGKNPLRSRMHERLMDPGANPVVNDDRQVITFVPHGLTLRAPGGRTALSLHADKLGNFYFFMSNESRLVELGKMLQTLNSSNLIKRRVGWPSRAVQLEANLAEANL